MGGIAGCVVLGVAVIQCIFNPLYYSQDQTTVNVRKVIITEEVSRVPEELFYRKNSWPMLSDVKWGSVSYICALGHCQKFRKLEVEATEVALTTNNPETTLLREATLFHETTVLIERVTTKTFNPKFRPDSKEKNSHVKHPHLPSPPQPRKPKLQKTTPHVRFEDSEEIISTQVKIFRTITTVRPKNKLSSDGLKEVLSKFKQEIEEIIMTAVGALFSAGTMIFIFKILYKHRKKLPCYESQLTAEIMEGGLQLLNNNVLNVSVQTETSMIESDSAGTDEEHGRGQRDRRINGGGHVQEDRQNKTGEKVQMERAEGGEQDDAETGRKMLAEGGSMEDGENSAKKGGMSVHQCEAPIPQLPTAPALSPIKDTHPCRKSARLLRTKTCDICT